MRDLPNIERVEVFAFKIPTELPESDGTLEWSDVTLVLVEAYAGDKMGLGYTFADAGTARLIKDKLSQLVTGMSAMAVEASWTAMRSAIRNLGRPGITSMAISAVDTALWDLKARLLDLPLVTLLGQVKKEVAAYGSGGFTSYTVRQLQEQLAGWVCDGMSMVKLKVGRNPEADLGRVRAAREAIGDAPELFVDANGAYSRKQALAKAEAFASFGVRWFEEPVSSDDLKGLRLMRDRAPASIDIAAGEYGYDLFYFRRMLDAGAVDVLQADATRCGGVTGFLKVGALCEARSMLLSAHTAPSLHAHPCCALPSVCHVEYFHDHSRIEQLFFEGAIEARQGHLRPDLSQAGMGMRFKHADAARYRVTIG